ncbi:MAG: hypothetical protein NXI08_03590 [bacterium]|nr:hypothetical protein [bacterium]
MSAGKKNSQYSLFWLVILCIGCTTSSSENLTDVAERYYQTYAERSDFNDFLSYYDSAVVFEDIVSGVSLDGVDELKEFFNWENPDLQLIDTVSLVVEELYIDDNTIISKGFFTPFQWHNTMYEAMHFTTVLTLNEKGKIVKQVDWINYPNSLLDYQNRANSNLWIKED